jgi:hypothetical protein
VICTKQAFSILITMLFLRPILAAMDARTDDGVGQILSQHSSIEHKDMNKTKWVTLIGSTLSVVSSSLLYINFILFSVLGEGSQFWNSHWLNVFVFGAAMDSICNDVGLLLVCGALKSASFEAILLVFVAANPNPTAIAPPPSYVPNSEASSNYNNSEVKAINNQELAGAVVLPRPVSTSSPSSAVACAASVASCLDDSRRVEKVAI